MQEMGRVIIEWTLNRIELRAAEAAPARITFDGQEYRRKSKSNRPKLGTLFGAVLVSRLLYEPLERGESSIFPLEINLGVVARQATSALAERVALHASQETQQALLSILERDHGIHWSVDTLRNVTAEAKRKSAKEDTHPFDLKNHETRIGDLTPAIRQTLARESSAPSTWAGLEQSRRRMARRRWIGAAGAIQRRPH